MIILEFRSAEIFQKVSNLLKRRKIPCVSEACMEEWRSSYIFLFEENVRTPPQREALSWARGFEEEDRCRQEIIMALDDRQRSEGPAASRLAPSRAS